MSSPPLELEDVLAELTPSLSRVALTDGGIEKWDSSLLTALIKVRDWCGDNETIFDASGLPEGVRGLLALAAAIPERSGARRSKKRTPFLKKVGTASMKNWAGMLSMFEFLGEVMLSLGRLFTGRARFRKSDFWLYVEQCGPQALGIVTIISVLVGAILGFVGAVQLSMFGAEVYVANLVGLGMTMEMGALMTGIILAGRTGASFAAQLGTMQVNEEIDALQTMGIPPMDYLVLPRMLALAVMTPLLVIYADALGILGGAVVGIFYLDISPQLFLDKAFEMVSPWVCAQGLIKGSSFGILVAIAGCMRGMQCGRSASGVGEAATSAVVTSLVLIVIVDALWTTIFMFTG